MTPRRPRHYVYRVVYSTTLLLLMCTAWLVFAGTQVIRNVGDMARFGAMLFQIMALVQFALIGFLAAFGAASSVAQEKDRRTLILLLLTRLRNSELVLGKLLAAMLNLLVMLAAAVPVFALITLFGGVSFAQLGRVFAVTLAAALAAGSLGSTIALWREKTFQTLSMTALALVMWIGLAETAFQILDAVPQWEAGPAWRFWRSVAAACSPLQAILSASQPSVVLSSAVRESYGFVAVMLGLTGLLNAIAVWRVRVWNPTREVRPGQEAAESGSIWGAEHDLARERQPGAGGAGPPRFAAEGPATPRQRLSDEAAEQARAGHVDAIGRARTSQGQSRTVWDNPVLWREACTWAYGRKIVLIRVIYWLLFALAATALYLTLSTTAGEIARGQPALIPRTAVPVGMFLLVSLVMINALAVTSITSERDGQSLDLLLVTDLTPREFVFGKLGGVMWITRDIIGLSVVICGSLWWQGTISLENLAYLLGGLAVMIVFVAMLGVHCGMSYANSRTAIGVSLGVVFFLFLGVITCIAMMISFSGSFQTQLLPFLAFLVGGGVGLYVSLGSRNPSTAILAASLIVPFATFFAITSFLLRNRELTVFLVTVSAYGFTTAAMMVPAISQFDIAMGRTKTAGDE